MNTPSKKALLFYGGWDGHHPAAFAQLLATGLKPYGIETDLRDQLDCLEDAESLKAYDVIIPFWTMGELSKTATEALAAAVREGTGLAGIHGGMGDAFRGNIDYEWIVGGHFVGHPHVGPYTVEVTNRNHVITRNLPASFDYDSEQYYVLYDPDVQVLAETDYTFQGRVVRMPVAWTRQWEAARVFYSALGHTPEEYAEGAPATELAMRGIAWATRGLELG